MNLFLSGRGDHLEIATKFRWTLGVNAFKSRRWQVLFSHGLMYPYAGRGPTHFTTPPPNNPPPKKKEYAPEIDKPFLSYRVFLLTLIYSLRGLFRIVQPLRRSKSVAEYLR